MISSCFLEFIQVKFAVSMKDILPKRCTYYLFPLIFLFLMASCKERTERSDSREIFRYNESKGISSLDPAQARNQTIIWPVTQLFNGLLAMDSALNIVPSIAKSWKLSPDGRRYRFILRNDVYFHDHPAFEEGKGRLVNARDFVYSFSRILDPSVASPGRWVFSKLDSRHPSSHLGVIAVNDTVLEIFLTEPFPPFPGILTMPYCSVVPQEVVEAEGEEFSRHPVGTGPFKFQNWREEEKLVLSRNDNYFEKDRIRQIPSLS